MSKVTTVDLESLKPHQKNANKGTQRGAAQLDHSIKKLGLGRSIVLDKNDVTIAGNHVLQAASEAGVRKVVVVETTGDTLVAVKRMDMDLDTDQKAVELALADNRVSQVNFDLDVEQLAEEVANGLDVSAYYRDDELKALLEREEQEAEKVAKEADEEPESESALVKLPMTTEQLTEFNAMTMSLAKRWDLDDAVQVVLEAMRRVIKTGGLR